MTVRRTILSSASQYARETNPYLGQLFAGLETWYRVRPYSAKAAIGQLPDLFHVHWPEQLFRSTNATKTLIKQVSSWVLITRIIRARVPIVWTLHNPTPHEASRNRREVALLAWLTRHVDARISLTGYETSDSGGGVENAWTILHGDYRQWLEQQGVDTTPTPAPTIPKALLFGNLRPYKGIEGLLRAAETLEPEQLTVHIVGEATERYRSELQRIPIGPAVTIQCERLDDASLAGVIQQASYVVLPYQRMVNSGALLLSLSLGVPVLAPTSPTNESIRAEVGDRWITLYQGNITAELLFTAAETYRQRPDGFPDLSRRTWTRTLQQHNELFDQLIRDRVAKYR